MHAEQTNSIWEELSPLLDKAMAQLGDTDRNAIVLRYFENKNSRDVGAALGMNEAAAQKRVARAVEKLRAFCTRRGVVAPAIALTAMISANAVQAAPVGIVSSTALALKGVGVTTSTSVLVKGTLELMRWAKLKLAVSAALGSVVVAGTVLLIEAPRLSQPSFQGRNLNSWLAQMDDGVRQKPLQLSWEPWSASRQQQQDEAVKAIHAMGDKALPYLQSALAQEDSRLDRLSQKVGFKDPLDARRHRATLALEALGPDAKPLLAQLTANLYGTQCPKEAATVLAAMGPEGWEILTKAISSTNNFAAPCSVWALGTHRATVPGTVEALESVLTRTPAGALSGQAAWALAEIGQDRATVVPLLIDGLKARDFDFRWACALALGELGSNARSAVPALLEATKDPHPKVSHDAAQALQQIDPQSAAQAGLADALATRHVPKTLLY